QRLDLRGRRDQHRGAAPSPRVGAGDQLDEGRAIRARADHLREADLPEEPLPAENPRQARRLQARRDRQAGRADAEAQELEEAGEIALTHAVMRGLDPRIHLVRKMMDCRVKPGNDQVSYVSAARSGVIVASASLARRAESPLPNA